MLPRPPPLPSFSVRPMKTSMNLRARSFPCAIWLACLLPVVGDCSGPGPGPGTKVYTFAVGTFDAAGNFTESAVVPHKAGSLYGYRLTVHSTSGRVRVREVLALPAAGIWTLNLDSPAGVPINEQGVSEDGRQLVQEFDIECGDRTAQFAQKYKVVEADPTGLTAGSGDWTSPGFVNYFGKKQQITITGESHADAPIIAEELAKREMQQRTPAVENQQLVGAARFLEPSINGPIIPQSSIRHAVVRWI